MSDGSVGFLHSFSSVNSTCAAAAYVSGVPSSASLGPVEFMPTSAPAAFVLGKYFAELHFVKLAWRATAYFYSKLPSFTLPGALADMASACDTPICEKPGGNFSDRCSSVQVTFLSDERLCELRARCETIYESMPLTPNTFRYAPEDLPFNLTNNNGTLVIKSSRIETLNAKLKDLPNDSPELLAKKQEKIIGALNPGDVLTVNSESLPMLISPEKWNQGDVAFHAFQRLARETGGIMGYASSDASLTPLIEKMSAHILKIAGSSESIDIAFVLDTTRSMKPYIGQVKQHLVQFIEQLRSKIGGAVCRVAVVEYRDKEDAFLNRQATGFTSDLNHAQNAINGLEIGGGGDMPEALFDALLAAKNDLFWSPSAKRIIMLISDAPPHPKTTNGLDESAVISELRASNTEVAVYPIFSKTS